MIKLPHIISTRKLNSNQVIELIEKGWTFTQHDFICKVIDIPPRLNRESIQKNIVLTSKSGVGAFLAIAKKLQLDITAFAVHCISQATRETAQAGGLHVQLSAPNASALADEIIKDKSIQSVTHLCSNLRREELSNKLKAANVHVYDLVAYRTEFTPVAIDMSYDAILFFSPSAVDSFLSSNALKSVPCFCIGQTTAQHAKQKGYSLVHAPDAPSEEALLNLLTDYFYKTPAHA